MGKGPKPGGGSGGPKGAAGKAAGGIFGDVASDLFRLGKNGNKNIDFLNPSPKVRDKAKKYGLPPSGGKRRPHIQSQKIPPGSTDLAEATQKARRHQNDTSAKNYAAYRYIDKNGQEHILVGRSQGTHSERSAGAALLDEIKKGNVREVKEVYTERAPCSPKKGNCDEWLQEHLRSKYPKFKSSHSWNYDGTDGTNAQVSAKIKKYAKGLMP
ncbi:nucleic acid/nucleotide deaminase domain-containing protein [Spirillospora sp. NPDC050679]